MSTVTNTITNQNKIDRINYVKQSLDKHGIVYQERMNGHLVLDGMNFWATTEKWYDPFANIKGKGINSFLSHLNNLGYVK